jgi:hypothetical protein
MIEVFHLSEAGGHAVNEDFLLIRHFLQDREGFLCALADGQGGQAGGAKAAMIACQTCMKEAMNPSATKLTTSAAWTSILCKADQAVRNDRQAGLTALVGFCIAADFICGGSCGDCALMLVDDKNQSEILTANQSKNPAVGSGSAVFGHFSKQLLGTWTALAMSDGVWKYASWQRVRKAALEKHGDELIQALLRQVRLPGSGILQDDFTLAVFHGDAGLPASITKGL